MHQMNYFEYICIFDKYVKSLFFLRFSVNIWFGKVYYDAFRPIENQQHMWIQMTADCRSSCVINHMNTIWKYMGKKQKLVFIVINNSKIIIWWIGWVHFPFLCNIIMNGWVIHAHGNVRNKWMTNFLWFQSKL